MRDYGIVSPRFWIDHYGVTRQVPEIKGRLKCGKCPGHRALREYVIHRDGYRCKHCGCTDVKLLVADHIVSRRNGSHHPDNLQCLCDSCNARKAATEDRNYA